MMVIRNKTASGVVILALLLDMDACKRSGYRDFLWAIKLSRYGLELVGLWPQNNAVSSVRLASDLRTGIAFITINFLSLVPIGHSLVRVWGDMILMMDNLQITLSLLMITLKIIVIRLKHTAISSIIVMMLEDWTELKTVAERQVMVRNARIARGVMIFGYILVTLGFIIIFIFPLLGLPFRQFTNLSDRNRPLPLQAYYFYDTDKSPQFELTFFVQAITIFFGATIYLSVDAFLGLSILHICGQLENFEHKLADWTMYKDFDSDLRKNVEIHRRLIRFQFVKNIEDTFSVLMLGLVFYFGTAFCLFAFVLFAVFTGDNVSSVSFSRKFFGLIGVIVLFLHTFLYCGAGELIKEHSDAIYRAMYEADWYKLESKCARSFVLLMIRAKEPFRITAGKIFPLTMTTFCSLLKTSAGYISFLLAMQG